MQIIKSTNKIHAALKTLKQKKKQIGLVPTMGALHEGHISLVRKARNENDIVVVSIFVNPAQFGPQEDYKNYPRVIRQDAEKCRREKVDFIFYPDAGDIYPEGYQTYIEVNELPNFLCGRSRPGHFKGVATIVLKLFNIIIPDKAYFGLKDYQQFIIIKKMVENLNLDVIIKGMPLVREKDGLALSSRNKYLNKEERKEALLLSQALFHARDLINKGESNSVKLKKEIYTILLSGKLINNENIDYVSIVHPDNLKETEKINKGSVIALAVRVGNTRLIDNIII